MKRAHTVEMWRGKKEGEWDPEREREKERERGGERGGEREREREGERVGWVGHQTQRQASHAPARFAPMTFR